MKNKRFLMLLFFTIIFLASCGKDKQIINECDHIYIDTIIDPTCTNEGYTNRVCEKCGSEDNILYVDALGHQCIKIYKEDELGNVYYELDCTRCDYIGIENLNTSINDLYGFNDLKRYQNKESLKQFYAAVVMVCDQFNESNANLEAQNISVNGKNLNVYLIDKIEYTGYELSINEALAVMNILIMDNPKYYFLSSNIIYDSNYIYLICNDKSELKYKRNDINNLIDNAYQAIDLLCDEAVDDEAIVRIIHDYINSNLEYALDEKNEPVVEDWAHNILGMLLFKKGVCETYSKLFKLLCDHIGIECLVVKGTGINGSHSWNIVKIDDSWYGIDLTYDDTNNANIYDYFLMTSNEMSGIYTPYSSLIMTEKYIYLLPEIAS